MASIGALRRAEPGWSHLCYPYYYYFCICYPDSTLATAALQSLRTHFPDGYRVVRPAGGYFLWVELPQDVDALEVHRLALREGISVAPGPMFSARREFRSFLRLNTGHPWTVQLDSAVATLGRIVRRLAGT